MGFPARLLSEDETLVLVLRRHVKVLFGPLVVLVVTVAIAGTALAMTPSGTGQGWLRLSIAVLAVLVLLRWVVWPLARWWTEVYVVTTRRLVLREGVLNRSGHDMPLARLNDISFTHTFFQRLLGCGTLVVESAGERGQIRLDNVPKVELVQRTLYRLADEHRGAVVRPAPEDMFDAGLGSRAGSYEGGAEGDEAPQ